MNCTRPSSGTNTALYAVAEIDCGKTPPNPVWKPIRFTGGIPVLNRDPLQSAELDRSREITNFRLGQFNLNGDTNFELSYGSFDDLLEGALQSSWVAGTPEVGVEVTVDATAKTFTRTAGDYTVNLSVGDLVKFKDLSNGSNAEPLTITALTATVLTAAGANGLADEAATTTDITQGDKLKVGQSPKSFSLLVEYEDLNGGMGGYDIITGCQVSTLSFSMAVNALVSGAFGFIGIDYFADAALPAGSTFEAAATTRPFTSFDGRLIQDGQTLGFVTSITPNGDNTAEANFEIGSRGPSFISYGKVNNTFDLESYFYDYALFKKYINEEEGSMIAELSLDGNAMSFTWPRFVYTSGAPTVEGEGPNNQNLTGQALKDATENTSLIIQRVA